MAVRLAFVVLLLGPAFLPGAVAFPTLCAGAAACVAGGSYAFGDCDPAFGNPCDCDVAGEGEESTLHLLMLFGVTPAAQGGALVFASCSEYDQHGRYQEENGLGVTVAAQTPLSPMSVMNVRWDYSRSGPSGGELAESCETRVALAVAGMPVLIEDFGCPIGPPPRFGMPILP